MSSAVGNSSPGIAEARSETPILSALLEQLPLGVVVASRDGLLEYVNPIAAALLAEDSYCDENGLPNEAAVLEPLRRTIGRALLTGEVVLEEEIQFVGKHHELRTLSVSATPVEPTYVGPRHVIVTLQDVTERNRGRDWEPLVRSLSRL